MKRTAAALALTLSLAACMDMEDMTDMKGMADKDSPTYNEGFSDGCATASAEGPGVPRPPQRDAALFQKDRDYRSGWNAGHVFCRMGNRGPAF